MISPRNQIFGVVITILGLVYAVQGSAQQINFSGQLDLVVEDLGGAVYSGVQIGTAFSGFIDPNTGSGQISDGTTLTSVGCCIAAGGLGVTDNDIVDSDSIDIFTAFAPQLGAQIGDSFDLIDIEGDATTTTNGRIEFGLSYVFPPDTFTNESVDNYPFDPAEVLTAIFFIVEEDQNGEEIYTAGGLLDMTQEGPVTFIDTEFLDMNWEIFLASLSQESSHTFGQQAAGGNPGAYREMTHTNPVNTVEPGMSTFVNILHRRLGWEYNPAVSGAIDHIDMAMDRKIFSITSGGIPQFNLAVGHVFRIYQDGAAYFATDGVTITDYEWETHSRVALRAEDFGSPGNRPDFSASGAPISFGFTRSNTNTAQSVEVVSVHGVDNFVVTVVPVEYSDQHQHGEEDGAGVGVFDGSMLRLPVVAVDGSYLSVDFELLSVEPTVRFELTGFEAVSDPGEENIPAFDFGTLILDVPEVIVDSLRYHVQFMLIDSDQLLFELIFAELVEP